MKKKKKSGYIVAYWRVLLFENIIFHMVFCYYYESMIVLYSLLLVKCVTRKAQ